ncbi:hypothetical protein TRAPUB_13144 [Trametes pubescens]|uniref:Uncharacterized protein n=1 Tax=Trametes pubescens TaxID=154538 RepID=A0A1M2VRV0_TRAPU|nr:hypothetical protein TRAPUB_13144 [Trametes pubescens]
MVLTLVQFSASCANFISPRRSGRSRRKRDDVGQLEPAAWSQRAAIGRRGTLQLAGRGRRLVAVSVRQVEPDEEACDISDLVEEAWRKECCAQVMTTNSTTNVLLHGKDGLGGYAAGLLG